MFVTRGDANYKVQNINRINIHIIKKIKYYMYSLLNENKVNK